MDSRRFAMLTMEENGAEDFVTIRASGVLRAEDFRDFVPSYEAVAARRGPLRICLALTELERIEPMAFWEDLKFGVAHKDSYERIAVVGDRTWQEWSIRLSRPFFRAPMRFFTPAKRDEAEAWLGASLH